MLISYEAYTFYVFSIDPLPGNGVKDVVLQMNSPPSNSKHENASVTQEELFTHRLVHLDLKGAPPTVAYLRKVFPLIRAWGATGECNVMNINRLR